MGQEVLPSPHSDGGHEDDARRMLQKRSHTIASISDEANDDKVRAEMQAKIDANEETIDKMCAECMKLSNEREKGSILSNMCQENSTVFNFMKYQQRERHITAMWLKAFIKAKAGAQVLQFTSDITKKIQILGIRRGI